MFEIQERAFGQITQYILFNSNTQEYASIIPDFGATINQVTLRKGIKLFELLDGCSTYEELITEGKLKFKGSKLFPFPNRIEDGQYSFEGKTYNFPINFPQEKNAIHGVVLDKVFKIAKQNCTKNEASLLIIYMNENSEIGYPFKSKVIVEYILNTEGFSCTTTIENIDSINIPVGDGWHPYIKTGSKMDLCNLLLPASTSIEVDARMIPTGIQNEVDEFNTLTKIGDTKFDTCFKLKESKKKCLYTKLEDPSKDLSILVWQNSGNENYNYLQIYIPPDRNSIAIEPMTCIANAFNNKSGLITLKPDEKCSFSFGLQIE